MGKRSMGVLMVKDGKIFGRGTEDNQQGVTSSIFTLLAFLDTGVQTGI
ncbi:MAG: hypothetical protein R3C26_15930 [Calditrichia bacterium]